MLNLFFLFVNIYNYSMSHYSNGFLQIPSENHVYLTLIEKMYSNRADKVKIDEQTIGSKVLEECSNVTWQLLYKK